MGEFYFLAHDLYICQFLLMLNRAPFALMAADANTLGARACPHLECDWWDWRICSGVIAYPDLYPCSESWRPRYSKSYRLPLNDESRGVLCGNHIRPLKRRIISLSHSYGITFGL